jgi:hypothetical protein
MRCSFDSSTSGIRWPLARLEVDASGITVARRSGELAAVRWEDVDRVVRCGYVFLDNVRVVPSDGPRFVVGGPRVVALVAEHLPEHLALQAERRRWYPWIPKDAAAGFKDRFPGSGGRT